MASARPASGPLKVVVIDQDPAQRRSLAGLIRENGRGRFEATAFASAAEAAIAHGDDIVVADLETIGGAARLGELGQQVIAISTNASLGVAVSAVKNGALDFLAKPVGARALMERLEAAIAAGNTRRPAPVQSAAASRASPPPRAPSASGAGTDFAGFIGRSPAMLEVYEQIRRIAPSRAPVFITGESGTGKEVTAEAIHAHSGPGDRPFVALNCSAIPKDLMESEIFGHVKGAFTGAGEHRVGAAERAHGGTLFLDEIAEMEIGLQAKLLRFLQSGMVQRVGGGEARAVDVRIVCATNRDPAAEVALGRFRADLYYRLHVLPIHLVPLRERREDIMPLAQAFLARYASEEGREFCRFTAAATERMQAFDWPGNVRQLANVIRRIVVLNEGIEVSHAMLPLAIAGGPGFMDVAEPAHPAAVPAPLWREERRIIETALVAHGGNIARAAAALEISPSTIYRKRQAWEERLRAG